MDQAELLTLIGNLYDKIVDDVAQRVITRLGDQGDVYGQMDRWAVANFDDRAESWAEAYLDDKIQAYLDDNLQSWIDSNLDIHSEVRDAVNELTFTVEVS